MYIKQIYTSCLAQASYFIESKGYAAVIDPIRDVDVYLELAKAHNAKIQYVFETHFHADFISGHLELARKTGAVIVFGPGARPAYKSVVAKDKDVMYLKDIKIELLHTPGHTLESSCYLLYNEDGKPYALFSGDTLFVGDVGRPDLGSGNLNKTELASLLFDSLNKQIKTLPDSVIVYPGHGAGSACGKNLSKETWSTIGEQKATNYALKEESREAFIQKVTQDLPPAPAYFAFDAGQNKNGYQNLDEVIRKGTTPLSAEDFLKAQQDGAFVLDARSSNEFGIGFVKGALNIGLEGDFAVWAGNLIPPDKPIILVIGEQKVLEAVTRLARIGFDNVIGYLKGEMIGWLHKHYPTDHVRTISGFDLKPYIQSGYNLLDVRKADEAHSRKIKGAMNIPLDRLQEKLAKLDAKQSYLIYCAGGYRSMIAASLLKSYGFTDIINVRGGINQVGKENPHLIESL
jgi:hydroxyacylglutathione hydrolase